MLVKPAHVQHRIFFRSRRRPARHETPHSPAIKPHDAHESALPEHVGHPAGFAQRYDKVNSHPIPHTQTDIRKMATQIDASPDAAAAAAAQHTPMMQRSFRLI
ncbi:hypothetical protein WS83_15640 [Burkholderia sp. MSMB2042]|nr:MULTISPECIES: hypothetical protein [Burkholderia]AOJ68446.1 hypothetical protein WS78_06490 [Burkholderia savannae]KVG46609.1 hypothetical protein WS77_29870 [Burkholderia sp. MSMB0265]KVG99937.1 hypothetical protein WS82_23735 [Burkholderia sp. MSMB2041]KVH02346.1 hypothetical protein WS83_15640 [Burkholderia sp. MSMB2042]